MPANNFKFDLRDHKFVLKEWLDIDKLFAQKAYAGYYSKDDIDSYLDVAYNIAKDVMAPANGDADEIGCKYVDGNVITPDSFKNAYAVCTEAGLGTSVADRESEGALPWVLWGALGEILIAGSPAITTYWGLSAGAAGLIQFYGNDYLKQKFLPKMFEGSWAGTMNLTEPGAGSDVGACATKAFATDTPGLYKIKGNKLFITAGDHDICENFIHMVLARVEGAREGTAGLSLFVVPKIWVNDDGTMGANNDVSTTGIEHKMGMKGSATCSLAFGENNNCFGYILGAPPNEEGKAAGMSQMFHMMNEERLNTGLLAQGVMTEAYYCALEYTRERVQGQKMTDPKGPRVRIIEHEDVRRMLLMQKAVSEACRALLLQTYYYVDMSQIADDPEEKEAAEDMFNINNPMCKAYVTDMAWPMIGEAIQTYGGYGFIEEYPVAQLARDCKIFSIWEGTNYIQSMDLVGRKFMMKKGKPFMKWLTEVGTFIATNKEANPDFAKEFAALEEGMGAFGSIMMTLKGYFQEGKMQLLPLYSTRILHAASMMYCGKLLLDQGILAAKKLAEVGEDHYDAKFYKGKIASTRFYLMNIVPQIKIAKDLFENYDTSAIDIPEDAFGLA
ncbi:MAG: acyl-CoA dehydrogenase [Syntrophomonadaceae bacterium]|nr:acyl-CoA dehydrogenase [Syntrophomonadaceae bacterium]